MSNIIWVDDDWAESDDAQRAGRRREFLDVPLRDIREALERQGRHVECLCKSDVSDAIADVTDRTREFALAILDFRFDQQRRGCADLVDRLRERATPYVIYTAFADDAGRDAGVVGTTQPIGLYNKLASERAAFVERVVQFLEAPPIRLIHISDIHFNSRLKDEAWEAQVMCLESLCAALTREGERRGLDGLVVTGDLAAFEPTADLVAIREWFIEFLAATVGRTAVERVFVIPGNHDLLWQDFARRRLGERPWAPFLGFLEWLFRSHGGREDLLSALAAWNAGRRSFNEGVRVSDLGWHRHLVDSRLSLVGLASPVDSDVKKQGQGALSQRQTEFVRHAWKRGRAFGEARIALIHHNVLGVLSLSRLEERGVLEGPGECLYALMENGCDVVLSGHTHAPSWYSISADVLTGERRRDLGAIAVHSAGTAGGLHANRDRPRAFSLLSLSEADGQTGRRTIEWRPFLYNSLENAWVEVRDYVNRQA